MLKSLANGHEMFDHIVSEYPWKSKDSILCMYTWQMSILNEPMSKEWGDNESNDEEVLTCNKRK